MASGLTSYSYHEEVLLLVPLQFDASLKPGQVNLQCQVNWLECQETCVPRQAKVLGTIEISLEEKASDEAPLIQRSADLVPEIDNALPLRADWSKTLAEDERILTLELDPQSGFRWLDFYPHENDSFELGGASILLPNRTDAIRLEKNVLNWEDSWPTQISGVALLIDADEKPWTRETTIVLGGSFPQTEKTTDSTQAATLPSNKTPQRPSMLLMLGFALLGGMILNLMPCVLPVISLKILGFVEQGAEDRKKVFQMGLLYGLGVLVSFWALASIVIAIQSTGQSANWGMQFQNPQFLLLMTILLTLIALNFFGVFEITGGSLTGVASRLGGGHGRGGAFANGVLATILAPLHGSFPGHCTWICLHPASIRHSFDVYHHRSRSRVALRRFELESRLASDITPPRRMDDTFQGFHGFSHVGYGGVALFDRPTALWAWWRPLAGPLSGFHRPFGMDLRGMHSEGKGSKGMGMGCSSSRDSRHLWVDPGT